MRDLVWTVIAIWLVYRLVDLFKSVKIKSVNRPSETHQATNTSYQHSEKEIKKAVRKRINEDGDYVDFEELN